MAALKGSLKLRGKAPARAEPKAARERKRA